MQFCIQDPSYNNSKCLHEILLEECINGRSGVGVYAFATYDGIRLLLEDVNFKKFIQTGTFLLIVGMDDITNVKAIQKLKELKTKYKNHLDVMAYIHKKDRSIFHPKFTWFKKENGGVLILGSGNLTQQGLRTNREAFTISRCDENEMELVIAEWKQWISHSESFLFDICEDVVMECAKINQLKLKTVYEGQKNTLGKNNLATYSAFVELFKGQPKDKKYKKDIKKSTNVNKEKYKFDYIIENEIDLEYWQVDLENKILIAEIPKNGNRMSQVNFDKKSFEEFFGARCGQNGVYRILFRHVNNDGRLDEIEVRQGVSVESHNYRFELEAAKKIAYPKGKKRPIGIFVKISERDFLYEIVLPSNPIYNEINLVMDNKVDSKGEKGKRIIFKRKIFECSEIYKDTKGLSIWKRLEIKNGE